MKIGIIKERTCFGDNMVLNTCLKCNSKIPEDRLYCDDCLFKDQKE